MTQLDNDNRPLPLRASLNSTHSTKNIRSTGWAGISPHQLTRKPTNKPNLKTRLIIRGNPL